MDGSGSWKLSMLALVSTFSRRPWRKTRLLCMRSQRFISHLEHPMGHHKLAVTRWHFPPPHVWSLTQLTPGKSWSNAGWKWFLPPWSFQVLRWGNSGSSLVPRCPGNSRSPVSFLSPSPLVLFSGRLRSCHYHAFLPLDQNTTTHFLWENSTVQ